MRKTTYAQDVFVQQFPLVKRFVYHLIYYRTFSSAYHTSGIKSEFWTTTIDAHVLQACALWCMVFGADGSSETHWKQLSVNDSEVFLESFRAGLIRDTALTPRQWERCWKDMTDFRNKFVAHRELAFKGAVPSFDHPLVVAYYYDDWVRRVITPDTLSEPLLSAFAAHLTRSARPLAAKLISATADSE